MNLATRVIAAAAWCAVTGSSCGFSPAQPTAVDVQPVLTLSPSPARRNTASMSYTFFFSISNPIVGNAITLRQVDFTVLGPDGAAYGTFTHRYEQGMPPGSSIGGGGGPFIDTNMTRPPATAFRAHATYTRADGTAARLEGAGTFTPPA